jgi:hypothetical protein
MRTFFTWENYLDFAKTRFWPDTLNEINDVGFRLVIRYKEDAKGIVCLEKIDANANVQTLIDMGYQLTSYKRGLDEKVCSNNKSAF